MIHGFLLKQHFVVWYFLIVVAVIIIIIIIVKRPVHVVKVSLSPDTLNYN